MEEKNKGVCCDVCDCEHNRRGCDCSLQEIKVSKGEVENGHHFCQSYKCKELERETNASKWKL